MIRQTKFFAILSLLFGCTVQAEQTGDTQAFITWGKQSLTPLTSLAVSSTNQDLQVLANAIGDAKVVALSEGYHNSAEMMQLHHRIIRYLVEEKGFNTVVTESGLPESRAINDYIKGQPATPDMWHTAIGMMYAEWQEGRDLVEWMRQYNRQHNNSLDYYGVDIAGFYRDWRPPFNQLIDYLYRVDKEYAQQLQSAVLPTLNIMGNNARPQHHNTLTPSQRAALTLQLDSAVDYISGKEKNYVSVSNPRDYQWALRTAIALQQADNYYHNHRHRRKPETSKYAGLNGREIAMARNILWALKQKPDAKVIVINHVVHTKTASQYQGKVWGNFTPMGQLLKQALKDDLYVIGMAYGGGKYWKNWHQVDKRQVAAIPAYQVDGMESVLQQLGHDQFFIAFDKAPLAASRWLNSQTTMRENDYVINIVPSEWNACIYLENTNPATPAH